MAACEWHEEGGPRRLDLDLLKQVKDANRRLRHLDVRGAFLGLGGKGGAFAAMFDVRVGHERVRSIDDESRAIEWLEENA